MGDSQATLLLMKQLKGARAPSASESALALHRAASARVPLLSSGRGCKRGSEVA